MPAARFVLPPGVAALMANPNRLGGVIHTYQKYDPINIPGPNGEPPDLVSAAFEHYLEYGDLNQLSEEELARAVRIDPSQIVGLGPSLEHLQQMLREKQRKLLETYETDTVADHCPVGRQVPDR